MRRQPSEQSFMQRGGVTLPPPLPSSLLNSPLLYSPHLQHPKVRDVARLKAARRSHEQHTKNAPDRSRIERVRLRVGARLFQHRLHHLGQRGGHDSTRCSVACSR